MFDHQEAKLSNCCEAHFRAAYHLCPSILPMRSAYGFIFLVRDIGEAKRLAKQLHIPKDHFKYCLYPEDLLGYRLPTSVQLFVSEKLDTLDNFLHKRFSRVVRPDLSIAKPNLTNPTQTL